MQHELMKATKLRETTQAMEGLSLDFNPRGLVPSWSPSHLSSVGHEQKQLDAIYVPTRGRAEQVSHFFDDVCPSEIPVYLLLSSANDIPSGVPAERLYLEDLSGWDAAFLKALRSLRCVSNPLFAVPPSVWDLPIKRNYALWHANKHGFSRILLLDDDIRGMGDTQCVAGATALSRWTLAGFFVDDFPDTSVIGHIELAVGESVRPFLSGSCLFVQTQMTSGFFPPIYNEDWIFMAHEIAEGSVCSLGLIQQAAYDPFARPCAAMFQEPGEIIADGLFALLAARRYDDRFSPNVWATLLSQRRAWLKVLASHAKHPEHRSAIDNARARCAQFAATDCVCFVSDYEQDCTQWKQCLKEME